MAPLQKHTANPAKGEACPNLMIGGCQFLSSQCHYATNRSALGHLIKDGVHEPLQFCCFTMLGPSCPSFSSSTFAGSSSLRRHSCTNQHCAVVRSRPVVVAKAAADGDDASAPTLYGTFLTRNWMYQLPLGFSAEPSIVTADMLSAAAAAVVLSNSSSTTTTAQMQYALE